MLLTTNTKNHILNEVKSGSSAGASALGSGPRGRWFKSTLPETLRGLVNPVPLVVSRAGCVDLKPGGRRTVRWTVRSQAGPEAGHQGGGGQIHSARTWAEESHSARTQKQSTRQIFHLQTAKSSLNRKFFHFGLTKCCLRSYADDTGVLHDSLFF